jgi:hypothetical protein
MSLFTFISGHSATPIDILAFVTIANLQDIPMKVQQFSWKQHDGWPLCPVSVLGLGRLYGFQSKAGVADNAIPFAVDNSLEQTLMASAIPPHQSVSGWTLWECPFGHCFPGRLFGVEDAEGRRFSVVPEISQGQQTHSLGTTPSFLAPAGKAIPIRDFGPLRIQECH